MKTARALLIKKHGRNGILRRFDELQSKTSQVKPVDRPPTEEERTEILRLYSEEGLDPTAIYRRLHSAVRLYRISGVLKGGDSDEI